MGHTFLKISDDRKSFICIKSPPKQQWISVFARGVFSEDIGSMIRWELTLISKAEKMELCMGYCKAGNSAEFDQASLGGNTWQCPVGSTLHVADGRVPQMRTNQKGKDIIECSSATEYYVGDRFRLDFDLHRRTCVAFVNDALLGFLSTDISERIYFVACTRSARSSFECTLFEFC